MRIEGNPYYIGRMRGGGLYVGRNLLHVENGGRELYVGRYLLHMKNGGRLHIKKYLLHIWRMWWLLYRETLYIRILLYCIEKHYTYSYREYLIREHARDTINI